MKNENNLRKARKRAGLEIKQVASLLDKSSDSITEYERGVHKPSLETVLKLEAIYSTPPRLLYQSLYEECRKEISRAWKHLSASLPKEHWFPKELEQLNQEKFCFYAEILKGGAATDEELTIADKHTLAMVNTISKHFRGRKHPTFN